MLGSLVGVRLLAIAKPKMIRVFVIVVLLFAGLKAMDKGLGLGICRRGIARRYNKRDKQTQTAIKTPHNN